MISLFDKKFTLLLNKLIGNYNTLSSINPSNTNFQLLHKLIYPYFTERLEDSNIKIEKINKEFIDDDFNIWTIRYKDNCYDTSNIKNIDVLDFIARLNSSINDIGSYKLVHKMIIPTVEIKDDECRTIDTLNFFIDSRFIKFLDNSINKKSLNTTILFFRNIFLNIIENTSNHTFDFNLYLFDTNNKYDNEYNKFIMSNKIYNSTTFTNVISLATYNNDITNIIKSNPTATIAAIYHMYKIISKNNYFGEESLLDNMWENSSIIQSTFTSKTQFMIIMERLEQF
jgi:hypothetical protein